MVPTVIDAKPLPAPVARRSIRRNGRVACLPKLQRDMVNRMIANGIHYKNIVAALDDAGHNVTERNISNWATGGYLEWQFAQGLVLQNRLDQDHLVDHLRRDDATELPEVGLQAAATRLSQMILQKSLRGDNIETGLDSLTKMVDLLCRLNREIGASQKQRDDSRRSLGREYDPTSIKEEEQLGAIENERFFSDPPADSALAKPAVPPALPPIPTAALRAQDAREAKRETQIERAKQTAQMMQVLLGKKQTEPTVAQAPSPASAASVPLISSTSPAPASKKPKPPLPAPQAPEASR